MAYEIRAEDDLFNVYEDGLYLGILSCPDPETGQTVAQFEQEMNELQFQIIRRSEIANLGDFDVPELNQWDVFAIDPGDDDDEFGEEEEEEPS